MWEAYLFQTASGLIGPKLKYESVTWSSSLNDTESMKFELRKSDLPKVDLNYWLSPWWAGVVLLWDGFPVVAGPITSIPTESFYDMSIECRGIRAILARRLVIDEQSDWNTLSKKKVSYKGISLGTIAKRVVQLAEQKPGGALPIAYPYADQSANHERNYQSFNLSNIFVDDVLTKLSGVTDGPDIMFRPRLVHDGQLIFDMLYGSEDNPRIPQKFEPVWDTTAAKGQVEDLRITRTGLYQTHRVFATGAGMDEGTLIRMAQDLGPTAKGYPLLESVEAYQSVETPAVLQNHAVGVVRQNKNQLLEISMTVRADGTFPLGTFFPGDLVTIIVKGWGGLKDGALQARLLNINGNDSSNVKMALQLED